MQLVGSAASAYRDAGLAVGEHVRAVRDDGAVGVRVRRDQVARAHFEHLRLHSEHTTQRQIRSAEHGLPVNVKATCWKRMMNVKCLTPQGDLLNLFS